MPEKDINRQESDVRAVETGTNITSLKRLGLHERVVSRLRDLIIRGSLAPGSKIIESRVAEQLDISRTPLREALKLLEREGLVEIRQNRGAIVVPLTHHDAMEQFEVLAELERAACEYAAKRMSKDAMRELRRLQISMEKSYQNDELNAYFKINQQIHSFIADSAKNSVLRQAHEGLLARVTRSRYFALSAPMRWDDSVSEHREILSALEARDSSGAGIAMRNHVLRTGQVISDFIQSSAAG